VQAGFPVSVVTVTPPPRVVKAPVSCVPPAADGVYVSAIVDVPDAFMSVEDGAPSDALGPTVSTV
jgi:hypothetical protein